MYVIIFKISIQPTLCYIIKRKKKQLQRMHAA